MNITNLDLYRLLVKFGATETEAAAAAVGVDLPSLATKQDLAELKASLMMFTVTVMAANTAIVGILLTMILWAMR